MKIIMVGTFPPHIHGMSTINQLIMERLSMAGWNIEKINTSPQTPSDPRLYLLLSHIKTSFLAWKYLLKNITPESLVYLGLSGGLGQIYNIITAILCRTKGAKCVLHHHSTAYLDRTRIITTILFWVAGKDAIHVVLCENMKINLQKKYKSKQVIVLSNLALLGSNSLSKDSRKIQTIGYLSNITKEKGGWEIIKLAYAIMEKGWPIRCRVAGPCQDRKLSNALLKAHAQGVLEWIGPVYAKQKTEFWNSIDLFIFPTLYKNEAEPLVIWEALESGVPVIAYNRGCIANQIGHAGQIISQDIKFVEKAIGIINTYMSRPDFYENYRKETVKQCERIKISAEIQWKEFEFALLNTFGKNNIS